MRTTTRGGSTIGVAGGASRVFGLCTKVVLMSSSRTSAVLWRIVAPLLLLPALPLFLLTWIELRAEEHDKGKLSQSRKVFEQTGLEVLFGERTVNRAHLRDED